MRIIPECFNWYNFLKITYYPLILHKTTPKKTVVMIQEMLLLSPFGPVLLITELVFTTVLQGTVLQGTVKKLPSVLSNYQSYRGTRN